MLYRSANINMHNKLICGYQILPPVKTSSEVADKSPGERCYPEAACVCSAPDKMCVLHVPSGIECPPSFVARKRNCRWVPMQLSVCTTYSATTPTGHLSQTDLLQSLDSRNDDVRGSTDSGLDTSRRSKVRADLDPRRPPSQNAMRSIQLANGRVPPPLLDSTTREFDGMRLQSSPDDKSIHHRKNGYFKPNGLRSAFGEKMSLNNSGKDDLVATGTLLNSVSNTRQLSKSLNGVPSVPSSGHSSAPTSSTTYSTTTQRPSRLSFQRLPQHSSHTTFTRQKKSDEPKYTDPLNGAEVAFQQRLAELATLEADTVRYERNKKMKKKSRDRDT